MNPWCSGLCHRNVKAASTGAAKNRRLLIWDGVQEGRRLLIRAGIFSSAQKESAVEQPPAPMPWVSAAWRGTGPSRGPSVCRPKGLLAVGATEYPKSWLAAISSSSTKSKGWRGYAMLLVSVSPTYTEGCGVQQSPAWEIRLLLGWSHSTCICTINQHIA